MQIRLTINAPVGMTRPVIRRHPSTPILGNLRIVNPSINIIVIRWASNDRNSAPIRTHGSRLRERNGSAVRIHEQPPDLPVELKCYMVVHVGGPMCVAVAVECDAAGARDVRERDGVPCPGQAGGKAAYVHPALSGVVVDHAVAKVIEAPSCSTGAALIGDGVADFTLCVADREPALIDRAVD